jgi:hypothetical protein
MAVVAVPVVTVPVVTVPVVDRMWVRRLCCGKMSGESSTEGNKLPHWLLTCRAVGATGFD